MDGRKVRDCPKLIHQYWLFQDKITTQNCILYKGQTVIIPTSMRREMLETIHYSHLVLLHVYDVLEMCYFGLECLHKSKILFLNVLHVMNTRINHPKNHC